MKNQNEQLSKKYQEESSSKDSDEAAQNQLKVLKKRGDTAVHQAVVENDPKTLRELLRRGLRVFNQSDADGATALHRAAEIGSIECAKILLEYNADIDAVNFLGQTSFHVAAETQDFEFGKFLIKNRARKNCRSGCTKCRLFIKQIERYDKNNKDQQLQQQQMKLEEQKFKEIDRQDEKLVQDLNKLDLLEEIKKCRKELGGPFFNKKENQMLRKQREEFNTESQIKEDPQIIRRQGQCNAQQQQQQEVSVTLETPVEVEKIRPSRYQKGKLQKIESKEIIKTKIVQRQDEKQERALANTTMQRVSRQIHERQFITSEYNWYQENAEILLTQELEPPPLDFNQHQKEKPKSKHKKKKREIEEIKTTRSRDQEIDSEHENYY